MTSLVYSKNISLDYIASCARQCRAVFLVETSKPEIEDRYTMNYGLTIISWNHDNKINLYTEQK
jgi:hypothetical protein